MSRPDGDRQAVLTAKPSRITIFLIAMAAGAALVGPSEGGPAKTGRLILATTTSLADSGLLRVLLPAFTRTHGIRVDVIAVGTGQALAMARRGDADLVIVHAPALEQEFVRGGYGVMRSCIAYNTFAIVGPAGDRAQIGRAQSATEAFARIAHRRMLFVSRGDGSGTEIKEKEIWKGAGLTPRGEDWYLVSGAGMGMTLVLAHEKQGYTLTDLATYLTMRSRLHLALLYERDPLLVNQYAAIATNPTRVPGVNFAGAAALINYLVSPEIRETIADFGRGRFSRSLFTPLQGGCLE